MRKSIISTLFVLIMFNLNMQTVYSKGVSSKNSEIFILLDRGIEDKSNETRTKQINQLSNYMEKDIFNMFKKAGHSPVIIQSLDDFKGGKNQYLLAINIEKYAAGSKAARLLVGFGAGAVSLDIHYELIGQKGRTIITKDDGVGSSRDWKFCVKKLNKNMFGIISSSLNN